MQCLIYPMCVLKDMDKEKHYKQTKAGSLRCCGLRPAFENIVRLLGTLHSCTVAMSRTLYYANLVTSFFYPYSDCFYLLIAKLLTWTLRQYRVIQVLNCFNSAVWEVETLQLKPCSIWQLIATICNFQTSATVKIWKMLPSTENCAQFCQSAML